MSEKINKGNNIAEFDGHIAILIDGYFNTVVDGQRNNMAIFWVNNFFTDKVFSTQIIGQLYKFYI